MQSVNPCRHLIAAILTFSAVAASTNAYAQKAQKRRGEAAWLQQVAVATVDSAIDELREVKSLPERVAMAEDIVRLLRTRRPERCRQLLDSLFGEAMRLKKEKSDKGPALPSQSPDALLQRIIKIAAGLDPALAQTYISEQAEEEKSASDSGLPQAMSPAAADLHVKLALDLIERDPKLAVSFAERSLGSAVVPRVLVFLEALRKRDSALANDFLRSALRSATSRRGKDINEFLLLYAYVFSPGQVPTVAHGRLAVFEVEGYRAVAVSRPPDPALARQYLQLSSQVILDPARYAEGAGWLTEGATGDLFFVQLITPHARAYLPGLSERLAGQQTMLANFLDPEQRASLQAATDRYQDKLEDSRKKEEGGTPGLESTLRRAEEASDPDQKDQLYYMAATIAVNGKAYPKALEIIDKLSDKYRGQARQFITFSIAEMEVKDNQFEKAEQWARRDEDLARRAFILNLIANSLVDGRNMEVGRAAEILGEVRLLAAKLDPNKEKIATLVGAAAAYSRFDDARAAELLQEAIRTANKVDSFTGDTRLTRTIEIGGFWYLYYMYYDKLTLNEVIARLGKKNFTSTLADLQSFEGRVPRLKAVIALCSAVLPERPAGSKE